MKKEKLNIPQFVWDNLDICEKVDFVVEKDITLTYDNNGLSYNGYKLVVISPTELRFETTSYMDIAMPFGNLYDIHVNNKDTQTQFAQVFDIRFTKNHNCNDITNDWEMVYTVLSGTEALEQIFIDRVNLIPKTRWTVANIPIQHWIPVDTYIQDNLHSFITKEEAAVKINKHIENLGYETNTNVAKICIANNGSGNIALIPSLRRCLVAILDKHLNLLYYAKVIDLDSTLIEYWEVYAKAKNIENTLSAKEFAMEILNGKDIDTVRELLRNETIRFTHALQKYISFTKKTGVHPCKAPLTIGKLCNTI